MATHSILYAISLLVTLLPELRASHDASNLRTWCDKTPNPSNCYSHLRPKYPDTINLDDFQRSVYDLAKQEATKAEKTVSENIHNLKNDDARKKWESCQDHLNSAGDDISDAIDTDSDEERRGLLNKALANVGGCYEESMKGESKQDRLRAISSHLYKFVENAIAVDNGAESWSDEVNSDDHEGEEDENEETRNINDEGEEYKRGRTRNRNDEGEDDKRARTRNRNEVVVAQDGSGDFGTINAAVEAAKKRRGGRFLIHLRAGTYNEYVVIPSNLKDITLIGEGIGKTIITGNKHVGEHGVQTYTSATFVIEASGFIAKGVTFRNTAGPRAGQAVAFRSHSDHSAFHKCSFEGYQDTLYLFPGRHFFRDCTISGSMDFIFGDSTAVFQNCDILLRRHSGSDVVITANKREKQDNSGFVFHNCRVSLTAELTPLKGARIFLGRPWGRFSRTVFMKSRLQEVYGQGWTGMQENTDGENVDYAEFENTGPGASTAGRVKWSGVRVLDRREAEGFTVGTFLGGDQWLPATGVPYDRGL